MGGKRLDELKLLLDAAQVEYQILSNERNLASAEDGAESGLGTLAEMAPTFVLHTEAGYLAAIVRGDRRLSYKKIKHELGLKNVALASPDEVRAATGAKVGWVCLINPGLKTIVDAHVMEQKKVYGGTGAAGHTLVIGPEAVVRITQAQVFDFSEPKGAVQVGSKTS